jgi:hypothetical protein
MQYLEKPRKRKNKIPASSPPNIFIFLFYFFLEKTIKTFYKGE